MIVNTDLQKEFRDIHKDKLAFLLGTGLSLANVEPSMLEPYVTMAINASIFKFTSPTYFSTCDGALFSEHLLEAIKGDNTQILLFHEYIVKEDIDEISNIPIERFHNFWRKDGGDYICSVDDSKTIKGLSSAHCGLHLLHIMGCNPIVLIGCDCKYTGAVYAYYMLPEYQEILPEEFKKQFKNYSSWMDWWSNVDTKGKSWNHQPDGQDGYLSGIREYWQKMYFFPYTPTIIDCSNSSMTKFTKMSLNEVLEKYGDRRL